MSLKQHIKYGDITLIAARLKRDYKEVRRAILSYPVNPGRMSEETFNEIITETTKVIDNRKKKNKKLAMKVDKILTQE